MDETLNYDGESFIKAKDLDAMFRLFAEKMEISGGGQV